MRHYENGGKWIVIRLDYKIDRFDFKIVLTEILKEFKEEKIKFVGWLSDSKVISINDENYIVIPGENRIKLKLTTDRRVNIPDKKKELYIKFSSIIPEDQ